jgi:hypothetical protein
MPPEREDTSGSSSPPTTFKKVTYTVQAGAELRESLASRSVEIPRPVAQSSWKRERKCILGLSSQLYSSLSWSPRAQHRRSNSRSRSMSDGQIAFVAASSKCRRRHHHWRPPHPGPPFLHGQTARRSHLQSHSYDSRLFRYTTRKSFWVVNRIAPI